MNTFIFRNSVCNMILAAILLPLNLFANEPSTGTLILIGSISGWMFLILIPLVFRKLQLLERLKSIRFGTGRN